MRRKEPRRKGGSRQRRNLLTGAFAGIGALFAAAGNATRAKAAAPDRSKVVYHLCDLDKVGRT